MTNPQKNVQGNSLNFSISENNAQKEWAGRDLNPRTPPCQGGILTKLDHRPVARRQYINLVPQTVKAISF